MEARQEGEEAEDALEDEDLLILFYNVKLIIFYFML